MVCNNAVMRYGVFTPPSPPPSPGGGGGGNAHRDIPPAAGDAKRRGQMVVEMVERHDREGEQLVPERAKARAFSVMGRAYSRLSRLLRHHHVIR